MKFYYTTVYIESPPGKRKYLYIYKDKNRLNENLTINDYKLKIRKEYEILKDHYTSRVLHD